MTDKLHSSVYDDGLSVFADTENLYLLSQDIGLEYDDISTYLLGTKSSPTISSPTNRDDGGREVTVSEISDGTTNTAGTATYFCLADNSAEIVLAIGDLGEAITLETGVAWTLESFVIGIPGPVS